MNQTNQNNLPPKPIRLLSQDQIEIPTGGGCMSFFGLPFLAGGVFLLLAGFGVIPFENAGEVPWWAYPLIVLGGIVFVCVGGGLAFGRAWVTIDRRLGSIVRRRGLLVPMQRHAEELQRYDRVALKFDEGDSETPDRYPVVLQAKSGNEFVLNSALDFAAGHRQAAYAAEFLSLPLEDATGDRVRQVDPSEIHMSLAERLRRAGDDGGYAGRPFSPQSVVDERNGQLTITIPEKRFLGWRHLPALLPIGFAYYFYPSVKDFLDRTGTPSAVQMGVLGFLALVLVVFPGLGLAAAALRARRAYSRLTVTGDRAILSWRGALRTRCLEMDVGDIIDIEASTAASRKAGARESARKPLKQRHPPGIGDVESYPRLSKFLTWAGSFSRSRGLVFKTQKGVFTFAAGLPDDELVYLIRLVRERILNPEW